MDITLHTLYHLPATDQTSPSARCRLLVTYPGGVSGQSLIFHPVCKTRSKKTRPPAAQCVMCLFSARSGSDIGTLMDLFEYDQINGKHSMINAPRTFPGFMSMFLPSWKCKILELKCWKWRCREDLLNMWKKVSNHLSILNSIAC